MLPSPPPPSTDPTIHRSKPEGTMTARLATCRIADATRTRASLLGVFASLACPCNTLPYGNLLSECKTHRHLQERLEEFNRYHHTLSKRREHERFSRLHTEPTLFYVQRFLVLHAALARNDSPVAFSTVASGPCACHQRLLRNTALASCYCDYCLACGLRLEACKPGRSTSACHAVAAFSLSEGRR